MNMTKPKYVKGDRCPKCKSKYYFYDWELYSLICDDCGFVEADEEDEFIDE